jgi:hypothetical protein
LFVSLNIKEYKSLTLAEKIKHQLGFRKSELGEAFFGDLRYYTLELVLKKGFVNYEKVYELIPRLAKAVVIPDGFEPPKEGHVRRHNPSRLIKKIGLEAALKLIETSLIPLCRRCLGLIDLDGVHTDFAEKMVKHAPLVKIVTNRFDIYGEFVDKMMDLYGAPVLLYGGLDFIYDCDVVYSPEEMDFKRLRGVPVITCQPCRDCFAGNIFSIKTLNIPLDIAKEIPPEQNPIDFLDAAYTYGNIKNLENIETSVFSSRFRDYRLEDILLLLKAYR